MLPFGYREVALNFNILRKNKIPNICLISSLTPCIILTPVQCTMQLISYKDSKQKKSCKSILQLFYANQILPKENTYAYPMHLIQHLILQYTSLSYKILITQQVIVEILYLWSCASSQNYAIQDSHWQTTAKYFSEFHRINWYEFLKRRILAHWNTAITINLLYTFKKKVDSPLFHYEWKIVCLDTFHEPYCEQF